MKRTILYLSLIFISTALSMQAQQKPINKVVKGPISLPIELGMLPIIGVSEAGTYLWGAYQGTSYVYNTNDGKFKIWKGSNPDAGCTIASVTEKGDVIMTEKKDKDYLQLFCFNLATPEKRTEVGIPDNECPNIHIDAVAPDGKHAVGRLADNAFAHAKLFALDLSDINNPKVSYLEVPKLDFTGAEAQYGRPYTITQNGDRIAGVLFSNSGFDGEVLIWDRKSDGSYSLSKPLDSYLFDTTKPNPGVRPEWEDYVTADPDKDPDKYQQQSDAFDKADIEWGEKYKAYTKNQRIDLWNVYFSKNDKALLLQLKKVLKDDPDTGEYEEAIYPLIVDTENYTCKVIEEAKGIAPLDMLINGDIICVAPYMSNFYDSYVITTNAAGVTEFTTMLDWIKQNTGTDLTPEYTTELNDQIYTSMGRPQFSADGKTVAFYGFSITEGELFHKTFIKFEKSILPTVPITPINNNVYYDGKTLYTGCPNSRVELFTLNGIHKASYNTNNEGSVVLPIEKGCYIPTVITSKAHYVIKIVR